MHAQTTDQMIGADAFLLRREGLAHILRMFAAFGKGAAGWQIRQVRRRTADGVEPLAFLQGAVATAFQQR